MMFCCASKPVTSTEAEGEGTSVDGAGVETQELLSSQTSEAEKTRSKGASPSQQSLAVETQPGGGAAATAEGGTTSATGISPSATSDPLEALGPTVNVEELHHRISESFSRKLAEWERRKYRRPTTPEMEHKGLPLVGGSLGSRSRKEKDGERSRSKKSREDKERERQEKLREREMQKVEKEQVKLEKEKVRIEKERLRAMERQAKLERMKGRLSQTDTDAPSSPAPASGSPPPGVASPSTAPQDSTSQVKVTADFKKKLEEWEQMKGSLTIPEGGMSSDAGTPSPQPTNASPTFTLGPVPEQVPAQGQGQGQTQDGEQEGSRPSPLTLQPYFPDSPEEASPVDKVSDVSYGDDSTSVTEESITKANISSLERANSQLLKEVHRKEQEYSSLQEEVSKLNAKLDKVRQEHAAEMARFKRELEAGTLTGPVQLEVGELESTVRELEEKIVLMEDAGDQLAESMESAAIGKWQSIEGEEMVSQELIDMVDQMKGMLVQAARTKDPNQKSTALHNFETVYSHAMKLQVQMNNLRVSQLERNKEIMLIKRQLLLQEVNNVLLQAHITRRETELYQYREAKKHGTNVRRWNTFSGQGDTEARPPLLRNVSLRESELPPQPLAPSQPPSAITATKHSAKHDDIPCVADEDASIPPAGVKPKTPAAATAAAQPVKAKGGTAAGDGVGRLPPTASCPIITTTAPTPEKPSDRKDQHLISPAAAATTSTPPATTTLNGTVVREQQQQQQQAPTALPSSPTRPAKEQQQRPEQQVQEEETKPSTKIPTAAAPTPASVPSAAEEQKHAVTKEQQQAASAVPKTTPTVPPSTTTTTSVPATSAAAQTAATSGASKVETGSPTLLARTTAPTTATTTTSTTSGLAQAPAAGQQAKTTKTETPAQPIPEGPGSEVAPAAGLAKEGETTKTPTSVASSPAARPPDAPQPAPRVDDKYSQPESVMECTISAVDTETGASPQRAAESGDRGEAALPSPVPPAAGPADGVDISKGQSQPQQQLPQEQQPQPPKAVRSPVSRQKYLRRQKEEREKKKERTASPKTPHKGGISGKPPPHPQSTPHQSPSSQRSKSVGDMDGFEPDTAQADAPLREVIQKFEKRATVCETEERKIEYRKTPSPTLHLPRVGLVSRVRRLKPAAELLEESQRYRSGHSIYATRIMNRYLPAKSPQSGAATPSQQDKENVSSKSYVQEMVRRLSREGTPVKSGGSSSASSCLSLPTATDHASPVKEQELVSHLIHKLSHHQPSSSGSGPAAAAAHPTTTAATTAPPPLLSSSSSLTPSSATPLKDVTNGGRAVAKPTLLAQAFGVGGGAAEGEAQGPIIPAATLTDQQHQQLQQQQQDRTKASEGSLLPLGATAASCGLSSQAKPDSTISPTSHTSMPTLAYDDQREEADGGGEDGARERAATYCVSEGDRLRQQQEQHQQQFHAQNVESIEHIADEFLDPALLTIRERKGQKISPSSSTKSKNTLCCQSSACAKSKSSSSSSSTSSHPIPPKLPSSPKSQERRGGAAREKKETIGVLCKQSMSFDLGVSLRSQSPEATPPRPQSAEAPARMVPESGAEGVSGDGDKLRPSSTSSEGEAAAASGDDKKKSSRSRFLDSSWLQKPKKFFKVSK